MRNKVVVLALIGLLMAAGLILIGCGSGPKLGSSTAFQLTLNAMPEISIDGQSLKFEFGDNTWIAKINGENYIAGTFKSEDTYDECIMTLKQTYEWRVASTAGRFGHAMDRWIGGTLNIALGESPDNVAKMRAESREAVDTKKWRRTSGPDIVLEYKVGPPATLSRK